MKTLIENAVIAILAVTIIMVVLWFQFAFPPVR